MTDVVVVGSGPGGVNAAAALLERRCRVVLLDYGNRDTRYAPLIPNEPFPQLRRRDAQQHRYLLGDRFEGIPFGPVRVGAQLTPPRMHILADSAERLPVDATDFTVSMSLAQGGLGAGWSAGVFPFTEDELRDTSLSLEDMLPHYDAVAERIGVAGESDDLEPFFPKSPSMMPPLDVDTNAETVFARYERQRATLNDQGFFLGRSRLAACTVKHRGRGPHAYRDLGYWADKERSIYRPQWTLEELQRSPNFRYVDRRLVHSFSETGAGVRVHAHEADTGIEETHEARALVLAAGTFATARIVLSSLDRYDTRIPVLCNAYAYVPTINTAMLTNAARDARHSLAQLTAVLRIPGGGGRILQAQLFSYRSLLTFKLMKESSLGYAASRKLLQLLIPKFAILGIHHEDRPAPGKFCMLRRGMGHAADRLEVQYRQTTEEQRTQRADERRLLRCARKLGCFPLKTIRPGHGSSLHYAGTFPMTDRDDELTCEPTGRLRGTRAVYLADGSVFPWIPPKGLTFNLMANADRVGTLLAQRLD